MAGTGRVAIASIALLSPCALPAATPAGTGIVNIATLGFGPPEAPQRVPSNGVTLTVDELLDVAVAADHPNLAVPGADGRLAVGFTVANGGNGAGSFALSATVDRDAVVIGLATDDDGDGVYDPAHDRALAAPSIAVAAGERRRVFVLIEKATQAGTAVSLSATAARGHGAPGTLIAGAGQGGGDAVVGRTGAAAAARTILVSGADAAPRLDKSQTVLAADGSSRARPGAVITYRLDARFAGPAPAVSIADAIPAGTTYVAGSITLDGRPLTDADDADPASFDGSTVRIALGDIASAAVRTVQFRTRIQ